MRRPEEWQIQEVQGSRFRVRVIRTREDNDMATTAFAEEIENKVGTLRDKVVEAVRDAIRTDEPEGLADVAHKASRIVRRRMADAADLRDETIYRIKRQPVRAVALAFGAGAVIGVVLGRFAGSCRGSRAEAKPQVE